MAELSLLCNLKTNVDSFIGILRSDMNTCDSSKLFAWLLLHPLILHSGPQRCCELSP